MVTRDDALLLLLLVVVMFGGHWHVAISASESGTGIDGIVRSNRRAQRSPTAFVLFSPRAAAVECVQWRWKQWRRLFHPCAAPMHGSVRISLIDRVRKRKKKEREYWGVEGEVSDAKGREKKKNESRNSSRVKYIYIYIGFSRFHPLGFLDTLPSIATREIPSWKGLRSAHAHSLRGKRDGCRNMHDTRIYACVYIYIFI